MQKLNKKHNKSDYILKLYIRGLVKRKLIFAESGR